MPSNPSVIPGTFGPDFSGLVLLGQSLAKILNPNREKEEQALEILRDPEYAEAMAKRVETAHAKREMDDAQRQIAIASGASQEEINKLADPMGKDVIDSYRAEMLAVGLDPLNEKHQQMVRPIFEASRSALDLKTKADIRARQRPGVVQQEVDNTISAQSNVAGALVLEGSQLALAQSLFPNQKLTAENLAEVDRILAEQRLALFKELEGLAVDDPALQALFMGGGQEAFVEGVLTYMNMDAKRVAAMKPSDEREVIQMTIARDRRFADDLFEILNKETEEGVPINSPTKIKVMLTRALNTYRDYDRLGQWGVEAPLFPMEPILHQDPKILGVFGGDTRLMVSFGFAPPGWTARTGYSESFYRGWINGIGAMAREAGVEASFVALERDPIWEEMDLKERGFALESLRNAGVVIPVPKRNYDEFEPGSWLDRMNMDAEDAGLTPDDEER